MKKNKYSNLKRKIKSNFEHLETNSLALIIGGIGNTDGLSCNNTSSSCGCDGTSVCNCVPPPFN